MEKTHELLKIPTSELTQITTTHIPLGEMGETNEVTTAGCEKGYEVWLQAEQPLCQQYYHSMSGGA